MSVIVHLIGAAFRAFFRILFTAIVCAGIGGGATLAVGYQQTGHWPPQTMNEVAAIAIALLSAYAGGLTVLVKEAVKGVATVEKGVVEGVEQELPGGKR
jgi:hypothetical protein